MAGDVFPDLSNQESMDDLVLHIQNSGGPEKFSEIIKNKQRTSTNNGILKSLAVLEWAQVFQKYNVQKFQDLGSNFENKDLERYILAIPGQNSGISWKYFWMLAGDENLIKSDRMICRFLGRALNIKPESITSGEAIELLQQVSRSYPNMTPKKLDHLIWEFERSDRRQ